ncbi:MULTISPECIES: hypothetical protein [unclassified Microbacterium]|uniref:hypothetical protein n=1 Tax=unclassified Microbacterium TaxID=2609290 RepID=UPI003016EDFF
MIRHGYGGWDKARNRLISVAHSIYKRSLHAACGHPTEKAFSPSLNGWVQPEWVKCQVCAARETALTELGKDDPKHGREWSAIPIDHFPYGDDAEPFQPWRLHVRPLDT